MKSGSKSYQTGLAAEDIAARLYADMGGIELARRWKTPDGEIDLIVQIDGVIIFVEVKARKTHARAASAISARQQSRLQTCGLQYLAKNADLDTACRFDLVTVNRAGEPRLIRNILAG